MDWAWIGGNLDHIWVQALEHLQLTGLALALGLGVALPLSAVALRWPRTYEPIAGATGVLYTIPSLAAFMILLPVFGGLLRGRFLASVVALASYTLLILIRNIVTGVRGVAPEVRDAATGMGYAPLQRFWRIELPLAVPTVIAGLRIATVTVIGLVTVTALLGLGGLGDFILDGLRNRRMIEAVTGIVGAVALATVLDLAWLLLARMLTPWRRAGQGA